MYLTKHVFIEIDTRRLVQDFANGEIPTCEQLREYAMIYDQGSMSMGNAIRNFDVLVKSNEDVTFTILPLELFSNHKLSFTKFKMDENNGGIIAPEFLDFSTPQISFDLGIKEVLDNGAATFTLYGILEYQVKKDVVQIPLTIDPVLRANQGRG